MKRFFVAVGALAFAALLGGCALFSGEANPPQQAAALNELYQAVAEPVATCIETPACKAKAGDELKAADAIAYAYVERATLAAKEWNDAPEDAKPAKAGVFAQIADLAKLSIGRLADLLKK